MDELQNKETGMTVDPFLESLDSIKVSQIKKTETEKSRSGVLSFIIRSFIVLLCVCVFIYSMTLLVKRIGDYSRSDDLYDLLADIWYKSDSSGPNPFGKVEYAIRDYSNAAATLDYNTAQTAEEDDSASSVVEKHDSELLIYIKSKMNALKKQNSDVIGWITIDNTNIDYPIAYSGDNEYYINHSFDGTYSIAGTIFMDYRDNPNFDDNYNTVIYGHNLMTGKMFSELDKFFTKSFFNDNRYIYIYNDNGMYVYETFCVTKINIAINYTRVFFSNPNEFVEFAYSMKKRSVFKTETDFNSKDKVITLSTCTNAHNKAERYCIMAKLVEIRR